MATEEEAFAVGFFSAPAKHCPHVFDHVSPIPDHLDIFSCSFDGCTAADVCVCVKCYKVLCARDANGHMAEHTSETGHAIVIMVSDLMVWCYDCDTSIDFFVMPELHAPFDLLHRLKFGQAAKLPTASIAHEMSAQATAGEGHGAGAGAGTGAGGAVDAGDESDGSSDSELTEPLIPFCPPGGTSDTALVYDPDMMKHEAPVKHPEQPARIGKIYEKLEETELLGRCKRLPVRKATPEELLTVHTDSYTSLITESLPEFGPRDLRARAAAWDSIYLNEHSPSAALLSAGATIVVTEEVAKNRSRNGVAVVRPPGHHAEAHCAMGFCLFNNVAVAAKLAVTEWGLDRVLIVDWDVHHGNGTQRMFLDDPSIMYFSIHRYDQGSFYPHSADAGPSVVGKDAGAGYNINIAWDTYTPGASSKKWKMGDAEYLAAWNSVLMPIAREFDPDLVIISAGFDAARGDPLGGMDVTPAGYAHMTHMLSSLADGRVVMVLEGGYNLTSISESFAAATSVLLGDRPQPTGRLRPIPQALDNIRDTLAALQPYWYAAGRQDDPGSASDVGTGAAGSAAPLS